jgi:hypothetical protein
MDHFKTGDRVVVTFANQTSAAVVVLASANGRSLMLAFDAMLGGYVGMMPILWRENRHQFADLIQDRKVEIQLDRGTAQPG